MIDPSAWKLIEKVNAKLIRSADNAMKENQRVVSFVRQSLVHVVLPPTVILCTLMPLVKDSLGDITKSKNYRDRLLPQFESF